MQQPNSIAIDMQQAWIKMRDAVDNLRLVFEKHEKNIDKSLCTPEAGIHKPFDLWLKEIDFFIKDWKYLVQQGSSKAYSLNAYGMVGAYTSIIDSVSIKFADRFLDSLRDDFLAYKESGLHIFVFATEGVVGLKIVGDDSKSNAQLVEKILAVESFLKESDWSWVRHLHNAVLL